MCAEQGQAQGDDNDMALWRNQWDEGCAWWPWASQNDPCSELCKVPEAALEALLVHELSLFERR